MESIFEDYKIEAAKRIGRDYGLHSEFDVEIARTLFFKGYETGLNKNEYL